MDVTNFGSKAKNFLSSGVSKSEGVEHLAATVSPETVTPACWGGAGAAIIIPRK